MFVVAVDPGPEFSAYVCMSRDAEGDDVLISHGKLPNPLLLGHIHAETNTVKFVIEMVASYGMPVGAEVFETCFWIGRFWEVALTKGMECTKIYRKDVKLHLCNAPRANDASIRQALIDRFGPPGTKKKPGMLYGLNNDIRAALAVAVTFLDTNK